MPASTIIGGRRTNDFVSSITVSLPISMIQALNDLTEQHNVNRSTIVSQAVDEFLKRLEPSKEQQESTK